MVRTFHAAVALSLLLSIGCVRGTPETPPPAPPPETETPPSTTKDEAAAAPTDKPAPPVASAPDPAKTETVTKAPAPGAQEVEPKAPAPAARKVPAPRAQPPKPAAPAAPSVPPRHTAAPRLDLDALTRQLKETKAIGIFTKLTLKNQVDDLLDRFREHHAGSANPTITELRRSYDLLMMKVLSLLQDRDQRLASQIVSSREAIWGLLADPKKFAALKA
jgi:hypothetical protein